MTYFKDLDEYSEEELLNELARRKSLQEQGCCDYCGRSGTSSSCKEKLRHYTAAKVIAAIKVNEKNDKN